MLEAIVLFAPALIALRFYNHLHRNKLTARMLVTTYGVFVVLINVTLYAVSVYLLGQESVEFSDRAFVNYLLGAVVLAFIFPFVVNLLEHTVSIKIKRNVR